MELTLETPLRSIDDDMFWHEDCITYGDACYDCAINAEMMTD